MRISISLATPRLGVTREVAAASDEAGLHRGWLTEYADRDALVRSMLVAEQTVSLGVGTGIAYAFTRHPLALAAAALDIHEASGGRFALGLGTGTGGMRARWYGLPSERPASYLRETVELLRAAWGSDGALDFDGDFHSAHVRGLALAERAGALPPLKIFGSGLGGAMLRVSATHLDGVLLHPLAVGPHYVRRTLLPALETAMKRRHAGTPELVQWILVSIDEDAKAARDGALASLAFYLATPSYAVHFADTPWATAQADVAAAFRAGERDFRVLGGIVPPNMADELTVWGDPARVREALPAMQARMAENGVSELVLQAATLGETYATAELEHFRALTRIAAVHDLV